MTSYTVKISVRDIVEMDRGLTHDCGIAILLDERLAKQSAPHVGTFLSYETWKKRIFKFYESINFTTDPVTNERVYTFRLRSDP